jgi:hypothetical protein
MSSKQNLGRFFAPKLEERNAIVGRLDDSIVMLERILQQARQTMAIIDR